MIRVQHPLYNTWNGIKQRCLNPKHKAFKSYGGRGIQVCERWLVFENFVADIKSKLGLRPAGKWPSGRAKYSLHRIRNHGNYELSNVKWATSKEQTQPENRRKPPLGLIHKTSVKVGDTNLKDACRRAGVPYESVHTRMRRKGCTPLEAVAHFEERRFLGLKSPNRIMVGDVILSEACRCARVNRNSVNSRMRLFKETPEQAIAHLQNRGPYFTELCRRAGVNYGSAKSRKERFGETWEQAIAHLQNGSKAHWKMPTEREPK